MINEINLLPPLRANHSQCSGSGIALAAVAFDQIFARFRRVFRQTSEFVCIIQ
jgi:hypothetical protein